jgi:hypothetical protein
VALTFSYPSLLETYLTFQRLLKGLRRLLKYENVKHLGDFYPAQVCIYLEGGGANLRFYTEIAQKASSDPANRGLDMVWLDK